ncbi:hypothetical protein EV421DRAFT_2040820 [Armillaria borealis]|uniref:Uncharacterized protein n=1 Tax=Armillaria borealis TaxID=47425 RepID=A0AA39J0E9_9AGAR|nr:hypothetical protein EV421DRAFT_2040820 [Armillaria borealis]
MARAASTLGVRLASDKTRADLTCLYFSTVGHAWFCDSRTFMLSQHHIRERSSSVMLQGPYRIAKLDEGEGRKSENSDGGASSFMLLLLLTAAPSYYEQQLITVPIRPAAGARPPFFSFEILRDRESFGAVSLTIFVHWISFRLGLPYSGHRFSQFLRPSSFYQRPYAALKTTTMILYLGNPDCIIGFNRKWPSLAQIVVI